MARRKVRLAYISNESKRKASYKKRKRGLLKKLEELTILCNVEACAIMYSAFDTEPVVWPSIEGMQHTVARFRSLPNVEQTRRMLNQENFVQDRIHKLSTNVIKLKKENREKQMSALMYRILDGEHIIEPLNVMDLNDLGWVINMHLTEINNRIEAIMKENGASSSTTAQAVVDDHQVMAQEVPVFNIPIVTTEASGSRLLHVFPPYQDPIIGQNEVQAGGSNIGVVAPGMFNFQVGGSNNAGLTPRMFNYQVGASSNNVLSLGMFNSQGGASSRNGVATSMFNFQVEASSRGVVAPNMFNFQGGASSSNTVAPNRFNFQGGASSNSAVAPDRFNFNGGPSIGCTVAPDMYNFQDGAFSSNATTPGMINYQARASRNSVVAPNGLTFQTRVSSNITEAPGESNYKQQ